jgi:hypothetical protein
LEIGEVRIRTVGQLNETTAAQGTDSLNLTLKYGEKDGLPKCSTSWASDSNKMATPSKQPSNRVYKIASIPGDGIGVEVIEQSMRVLKKIEELSKTFSLHIDHFDWSSDRYKKLGEYMPEDGLQTLRKYDAILFGAVGSPGRC